MKKIKRSLRNGITTLYGRYDASRRRNKANGHAHRLERTPLTRVERIAIKTFWGDWGGDYWSFEFYKSFCGFVDVHYVPDDYYDFAEHVLNLRWSAFFLQHKCNLKYLLPSHNRPRVVVQRIDGHYVTEDNDEMTEAEAVALLRARGVFIAKNALGPGGGAGVRRIDMDGRGMEQLAEVLGWHDITFEEVVRQHPAMARLNPDSVNTIRFVTLNINMRCTVLSAFVRMGSRGSVVDNLSGGDGVLVGVNQEGWLNDFGVDKHFDRRYTAPTGVAFKGLQIPGYEGLKGQVVAFHQKIPYANLIGWDVAVDEAGNPVVLEINLDSAVLEAHQAFNGPIFGERLAEVMEYIEAKKPLLRHAYITY